MNSILRNILAVIAGLFVGMVVNMGIVTIGPDLIPYPKGIDMTTVEGVEKAMPFLEPRHFIMPFLAHALGTLIGAMVVAKLAISNKIKLAMIIGVFFLAGGITMVVMAGGPIWVVLMDLGLAYIPMAYLGGKLMTGKSN